MGGATRVLLVEDDEQLLELTGLVLERAGFEVVGQARSYAEAIDRVGSADVAVVDLRLGGKSGIEVTRDLTARGVAVLIYTGAEDREALRAATHAGARGVALKGAPIEDLAVAVRKVADGGDYVAPRLRDLVSHTNGGRLSPREREVLFLLATGLSNDEVAVELGLSPQTTKTQLKTAMRKLGARSRVEAVIIASGEGEITLP